MFADLRYTARQLARAPGFAATVVTTLAVAVAACTIVYSLLDRVVLRPLICDEPDRMVRLAMTQEADRFRGRLDGSTRAASWPDFQDWIAQTKSFELLCAGYGSAFTLTGVDEPVALVAQRITPGYFETNGIRLAFGRGFRAEEWQEGRNDVVVLTRALWRTAFAGDPDILGRKILLNEQPHTVVGVATDDFLVMGGATRLWVPLVPSAEQRAHRDWRFLGLTYGRLRPGVTAAEARAELELLNARLAARFPDTNKGWSVLLLPMAQWLGSDFRRQLFTLLAAVAGVLLIACANVAALQLIRGLVRQRELTVRAACGAARPRLVRLILTESALLGVGGCALGWLLSVWGLAALRPYVGVGNLVRLQYAEVNLPVAAVAIGCCLLTVTAFGLLPAWLISRTSLREGLQQGSRTTTETRGVARVRPALLVAEMAVALVLLVGTGLLLQSFRRLARVDHGFDPAGLGYAVVHFRGARFAAPAQRAAFVRAACERLGALPGVRGVDLVQPLPFAVNFPNVAVAPADRAPALRSDWPEVSGHQLTPGAAATFGLRLRCGRMFGDGDTAATPLVALINETVARKLFPDKDPLGRRLVVDGPGLPGREMPAVAEIVGVVGDVVPADPEIAPRGQVYLPWAQAMFPAGSFVFRTAGDPRGVFEAVRREFRRLDPDLPVRELAAADDALAAGVQIRGLLTRLLAGFAAAAVAIAAIGLYGVIAYSVGRRGPEFGIRLAFGAPPRAIRRLVLGQGLRLTGVGLALGAAGSVGAAWWLWPYLYRPAAGDVAALAVLPVFLAGVAVLACWWPARRATRVDPVVALHAE